MKLSKVQIRALNKLDAHEWWSAYEINESLATLQALKHKGLVESKHTLGAFSFPRIGILFRIKTNIL